MDLLLSTSPTIDLASSETSSHSSSKLPRAKNKRTTIITFYKKNKRSINSGEAEYIIKILQDKAPSLPSWKLKMQESHQIWVSSNSTEENDIVLNKKLADAKKILFINTFLL